MLPRLMAPNITVTISASPRPRTQAGRPTWADTLMVASTAIHERPAQKLAASAAAGLRARPHSTRAAAGAGLGAGADRPGPAAVPEVPALSQAVGPEPLLDQRQDQRADHGAGA